ncbi:MAG: hypothetical protein J1E95_07315 [Muribaculaceae bacterium]|nr:hypothetical protein [Muribaculaceae bacterium]
MNSDINKKLKPLTLEEIRKLSPEAAVSELNILIELNPGNEEALTLRGMRYWALNRRDLAINDYLAAIKINPQSNARMALQMAYSILDYYNKDLLNP